MDVATAQPTRSCDTKRKYEHNITTSIKKDLAYLQPQ